MRIVPILFNTDMVRALLEGRKTVTRRVVKPQPKLICAQDGYGPLLQIKKPKQGVWFNGDPNGIAPYQPDDILYVREAWAFRKCGDCYACETPEIFYQGYHGCFEYKASYRYDDMIWRPAIHMPKKAARIFLRVTNVRVERLQSIKSEQAVAEGAVKKPHYIRWGDEKCLVIHGRYKEEFSALWNNAIKPADLGKYGWDANPWVWVIAFERCGKPEEWAV